MATKNQGKKGKRVSVAAKAFYLRYKNEGRYSKNRAADLEKHVDANPNDLQAAKRLNESGTFEYRRNVHGKSKLTKDSKDKYRLSCYINNNAFPEQKRVTQNQNYEGVGATLKEQLAPFRGLMHA